MSDYYVGEIKIVPFNFAPVGWATCDGQIMPIAQNTALFSLLGTQFGGDGLNNFALPNFQGSMPLGQGSGVGLSQRIIGETGGEQNVTLLYNQMAAHSHAANCSTAAGDVNSPASAVWAQPHLGKTVIDAYTANTTANVTMNASALSMTGGNTPHNNMPPFLTLTFIIALQGIFPPRS